MAQLAGPGSRSSAFHAATRIIRAATIRSPPFPLLARLLPAESAPFGIRMDTQRLILLFIFLFSGWMLFEKWQAAHQPPPVAAPATQAPATPQPPTDVPPTPAAKAPPAQGATTGATAGATAPVGKVITVATDLLRVQIDTAGGVIQEVALLNQRDTADEAKPYLALLRTPERTNIAQAGLLGEGMPNHRTLFEALPGPRELAAGADSVQLVLEATAQNGDKVRRVFTFHRGSYVIDVGFEITNAGTAPISPYAYFQLVRDAKTPGTQSSMAPVSYAGPVIYNPVDKYKKIEFSELDKEAADPARKIPFTKNTESGWVGMVEHYFVAAWLPSEEKRVPRE